MTDVALSSPVADAAVAMLGTIANPAGGTLQVGDAASPKAPKPTPAVFYPYLVVRTSIVRTDGSTLAPNESGLHRIEVTAVGLDRRGVDYAADAARQLLLDRNEWSIDGYVAVWTEDAGGQSARPDFDITPNPLFAVVVVNVYVTPDTSGS